MSLYGFFVKPPSPFLPIEIYITLKKRRREGLAKKQYKNKIIFLKIKKNHFFKNKKKKLFF